MFGEGWKKTDPGYLRIENKPTGKQNKASEKLLRKLKPHGDGRDGEGGHVGHLTSAEKRMSNDEGKKRMCGTLFFCVERGKRCPLNV